MPSYITYAIRPGDTLGEIAARYGTTSDTLARLNGLVNPNLIYPGDTLSIPSSGQSDHADPAPGNAYDVLSLVVAHGMAERGKPYCGPMVGQPDHTRHGNPGWDCSAFVAGMYRNATNGVVKLTAYTDAAYDQTVPVDDPQPGHIVFYRYDDNDPDTTSRFPHMGIWMNDGETLDCRYGRGVGVHAHLATAREVRAPRGLTRANRRPTWEALLIANPNIRGQLTDWQEFRRQDGNDPLDWEEFRQHEIRIYAPDPGPLPPADFGA
jgi:LysM repeat protein